MPKFVTTLPAHGYQAIVLDGNYNIRDTVPVLGFMVFETERSDGEKHIETLPATQYGVGAPETRDGWDGMCEPTYAIVRPDGHVYDKCMGLYRSREKFEQSLHEYRSEVLGVITVWAPDCTAA